MPKVSQQVEAKRSRRAKAMAKRIRQVREARGFTQFALEDQAGIARGVVSRLESEKKILLASVYVIESIADALKVDVGWLITGVIPDGTWQPPKLKRPTQPRVGRPPNRGSE